jgi:hypothetical protein
LVLALATGCDLPGHDGGHACTDIAASSVSLEVVDAQTGARVDAPVITFTVDDGEQREPADAAGETIVLAYEEVGTFEVEIGASGYATTSKTYEVELDEAGCHPEGIVDTVELEPAT